MPVVTILVGHVGNNVKATNGTDSQANNVDQAEYFIVQQTAQGRLEIVFDHEAGFDAEPGSNRVPITMSLKMKRIQKHLSKDVRFRYRLFRFRYSAA